LIFCSMLLLFALPSLSSGCAATTLAFIL
jgi:hypothetical protein